MWTTIYDTTDKKLGEWSLAAKVQNSDESSIIDAIGIAVLPAKFEHANLFQENQIEPKNGKIGIMMHPYVAFVIKFKNESDVNTIKLILDKLNTDYINNCKEKDNNESSDTSDSFNSLWKACLEYCPLFNIGIQDNIKLGCSMEFSSYQNIKLIIDELIKHNFVDEKVLNDLFTWLSDKINSIKN